MNSRAPAAFPSTPVVNMLFLRIELALTTKDFLHTHFIFNTALWETSASQILAVYRANKLARRFKFVGSFDI